ncbi:Calpain-type cysteine protease dek1 [Phlyctochytrium planicorne]|nr:Calpain-type cysteine protease dek1 [Phlyctochytrium planicorne]
MEIREVSDVKIGKRLQIDDFFKLPSGSKGIKLRSTILESEPLRLLKLRNPWGEKEWKGSFGVGSEEWTPELKAALNYNPASESGSFWISYHDFLLRFNEVDVCFTHENWFTLNIPTSLPPSSSVSQQVFELQIFEPTWTYFSICQPNKRGKANEKYFYSDICLMILRLSATSMDEVEDIRFFGPCRASHFDIVLTSGKTDDPTATFVLIPFSVEREIAILEENAQGLEIIGAGGKVKKGIGSPEAPFSLRILSAHAVGLRQRNPADIANFSTDLVWDYIDMALCLAPIVNRNTPGSPRLVIAAASISVCIHSRIRNLWYQHCTPDKHIRLSGICSNPSPSINQDLHVYESIVAAYPIKVKGRHCSMYLPEL